MKKILVVLLTVLALMSNTLGVTPVHAANNIITVNTPVDEETTNGKCSLREAIINANINAVIHPDCATAFVTLLDTINFAGNYTITLTTGEQLPTVTSPIIIKGKGVANTIIQASACNPVTLPGGCTPATYRVFEVSGGGGNLTLDSLRVRHGRCIGGCEGDRPDEGGGIYNEDGLTVINSAISGNRATNNGGGISNRDSSLTVMNSTFSGNSALVGGGIFINDSNVTVTNSTFSGNSATDNGGGIYTDDILNITNSTFSGNNSGENGGGIYNNDGNLTVTSSSISGNVSDEYGGGIRNSGTIIVENSMISGNSASNGGGGISHSGSGSPLPTVTNSTISGNNAEHGGGIYNNGDLNVVNNTLSGNGATTRGGGISNDNNLGIYNSTLSGNNAAMGGGVSNDGNLWLGNATISGNEAYDYGGGIYSDGSAWIHNSSIVFNILIEGTNLGAGGIDGDVALYNSLVAGNTRAISSTYQDCSGIIYLEGYNLVSTSTNCTPSGGSGSWDLLNSLGLLGPLQNNGGPTFTHALLPGSNAIDTGDNTLCVAWPVNNLDQRGKTRPQGSYCDVGAYEAPLTANYSSAATQDGWVLESTETSNKGGTMNKTAALLYIGDNAQDKQYRSILSFNTAGLPDNNVVITSVKLRIKVQGFVGGNMFTPTKTLGNLHIDISDPYFGNSAGLVVSDFQAGASKNSVGVLGSVPGTGWRMVTLKSAAYEFINLTGTTQFRLRFQKDDNDDLGADYLKIYSGDAPAASRPQLIVEYYIP